MHKCEAFSLPDCVGGGARYLRYFIGGGQITAQLGGGLRCFYWFLIVWNHLVAIQIGQSTWNQLTNNTVFYLQLRITVQIACIESFHFLMGGGHIWVEDNTILTISHLFSHLVATQIAQSTWIGVTNNSVFYPQLHKGSIEEWSVTHLKSES